MRRWRKEYSSQYKRKLDEQFGFVMAFVMNGIVGAILYILSGLFGGIDQVAVVAAALPWVVNLGLIGGGLFFRPGMAVGYLYAVGFVLLLPIVLGVLFIGSCIVSIPILLGASALAEGGGGDGLFAFYGGCLLLIFFAGLYWLVWPVFGKPLVKWWRDYGLEAHWDDSDDLKPAE